MKFIIINLFFILSSIIFETVICLRSTQSSILTFSGIGVLLSLIPAQYYYYLHTRCQHSRLNFNITAFNLHVAEFLYGQHLVHTVVSNSLKAHLLGKHSRKALVMSFHGWTGSGKNYMSKLIASNVFGPNIDFVHWYIATRDFPHQSEVKKYQDKLHAEIPKYTNHCGKSLFIFDEIDKMPHGVIDAIKPYIDFYDEIGGIDYRNNIFIFLSNVGGREITKVAFDFWADGKDREDINMRDIEPLINQGAFNEIGGLHQSDIVKMNLIDAFVPFLPLEKHHIKQCIRYEISSRGMSMNEDVVNKVAEEIIYYPPDLQLYSVSGCKKIAHKVDLFS